LQEHIEHICMTINILIVRIYCRYIATCIRKTGKITTVYPYDQDINRHANMFYMFLQSAITSIQDDNLQYYLRFVKSYADTRFNIDKISAQWTDLLTSLKIQYPEGQRGLPKAMFRYRTA